ncbi:bacteriohemerythrin [Clostridium sp. JN-9]|uniref:bacteriohemerythrin n=1 Tax=Clostridium sp. JN-9 TaxID=2507159 RepID=UPI000FFDFB94|nr:bacteriohemerythrin [Clostridium sp. JN-9]QAT39516.1 bacteriohemerythrin [Clostridium sp. JN-9]
MIAWKDDFLVGIDEIDKQHKKLFSIANEAYELLNNDFYVDKYDKIISIIEELKDYTVFHFTFEEEYMMKIKYKKFFPQKIQHESFIKKINEINLNDIDSNQDKALLELLDFIINWISNHILIMDKQIGK